MSLFTEESYENLRQKVNLIETVSPFVSMIREGSFFKGQCPFRREETLSFIIGYRDSYYHCYECGAHGDAISFLMAFHKISFSEAVNHLAIEYGVSMEKLERNTKSFLKTEILIVLKEMNLIS